jgi:hypothetical protein
MRRARQKTTRGGDGIILLLFVTHSSLSKRRARAVFVGKCSPDLVYAAGQGEKLSLTVRFRTVSVQKREAGEHGLNRCYRLQLI